MMLVAWRLREREKNFFCIYTILYVLPTTTSQYSRSFFLMYANKRTHILLYSLLVYDQATLHPCKFGLEKCDKTVRDGNNRKAEQSVRKEKEVLYFFICAYSIVISVDLLTFFSVQLYKYESSSSSSSSNLFTCCCCWIMDGSFHCPRRDRDIQKYS